MIHFDSVSKEYRGARWALRDVSVTIPPGMVTGLLGPNGAGKSTAMRLALGLCTPTSGRALVNGVRYRDLPSPARTVGACLDGRSAHPGRSARAHLTAIARYAGLERGRVATVLEMVGLIAVADRRVGEFSLGMSQRLGVATALIGDPEVLVLDEPVNGLDADGVRWVRDLLRGLASEGRTVLLSSHLLAELEHVADRVVIIDHGHLLHDGPVADLTTGGLHVRVVLAVASEVERLIAALRGRVSTSGASTMHEDGVALELTGASVSEIGDAAHSAGVRLHGLWQETRSLEEGYTAIIRAHSERGASE